MEFRLKPSENMYENVEGNGGIIEDLGITRSLEALFRGYRERIIFEIKMTAKIPNLCKQST